MQIRYTSAAAFLLMCGFTGAFPGTAASQEAQSVKLGEAALRFSAGFIRETMPQDGIVNFITGDNQTTGNRMILGWRGSDVLYLKLHHLDDAAPGDLYTVYRRVHKVFHPLTKRYLGYVVNMLAVVRVIQTDHTLATVQIVRSFAPVSPGDSVMRFVPPAEDDQVDGPPSQSDSDGMIVDLQADKTMSLVGQGNVVYLDRGRGDGMRPGDRLEVDRLGGGLPRRQVAEIKILSTEDRTATALITKSMSRVLVGDRVRYRGHGAADERRSQRESAPLEELSLAAVTKAEPKPALSTYSAKSEANIHMLPGAEGTRIDLEDLVEQLEYDSGEVKVKPSGLPILDRIADFLRTAAVEKPIRVEGHADNMEIGPSLRSVFPSNWELSRGRAAAIVQYLIEKGGLDSAKLTAVGYGATRPLASNATEEGRKRNRRIEIVLFAAEPSRPQEDTSEAAGNNSPSLPKDLVRDQTVFAPIPMPAPMSEQAPTTGPSASPVSSSGVAADQTIHMPATVAQPPVADVAGGQPAATVSQ